MNPFWSPIARELSPYVPGEQPRIADLVKLNTNEGPFGPSPLALEAMRAAAAETLRRYPESRGDEAVPSARHPSRRKGRTGIC
jgi:histidinol-phosphate aminotransferase